MDDLATVGRQGFARYWLLAAASAAASDLTPSGTYGRFFGGPPPRAPVTAWQVNGGLTLALAAAALGASPETLMRDLEYTGQLMESQAVHDLRIYTASARARITHGRTSRGREADIVVEYPDGTWALIEVKLGARKEVVDAAAASLRAFAEDIRLDGRPAPQLIVLTGTGPALTRRDGIHQVSLTTLGP